MVAREQGRGQDTLLWSDGAMAPEYPSGYPDTLFMRREMDKSSVRNELFDKAKEVGEFEVFPTPSEAEEDLDNAFLISTGILLGVPKLYIVRVEEFHYSEEEADKETDKILQEQKRHIERVLSEHRIVLSEAAWNTVFSYAVLDEHPSRTSGRLSEDEVRSVEEAFDALGLDP